MTKVLNLALLGQLQLSLDNSPLEELASAKAQALLCYLAVNGRSYSRQILAALLWGELPEAGARRNLRGVIMKLRQTADPYLTITHQTITFNRESAYWLDVEQFLTAVKQQPHSTPNISQLETAVPLYRSEFLDGFYVRQAPNFEAWLQQQRVEFQRLAIEGHDRLAALYCEQANYEAGISIAHRLIALDSTREASHRLLMRLLALNGQRTMALSQLEKYREQLQDELGVDVSPETAALANQIRHNQLPPPSSPLTPPPPYHPTSSPPHSLTPSPPFIAGPPITHPAQFFGREREIRRLFNMIRQRPLQNAAIIGPRRSGKTSLLHYLRNITHIPANQLRPQQTQNWLHNPASYRWVLVDFQDPRLGTIDGLLRYLLTQMSFPLPDLCDIDTFLDIVADHLHTPTVILLDEIGVALARYPQLDDAFWESLRSLATNLVDGNLGFILTSHEPPDSLAQHQGLGSPFFNIFGYTAVLHPLTEPAARELMAASPLPFSEADITWILAESGRWPMPLQILCRERLLALEEGDEGDAWQIDGRRQITPFIQPAKS